MIVFLHRRVHVYALSGTGDVHGGRLPALCDLIRSVGSLRRKGDTKGPGTAAYLGVKSGAIVPEFVDDARQAPVKLVDGQRP